MEEGKKTRYSCDICTNCPICYKKAIESGEDFKLMRYFTIFIIIAFLLTSFFEI